jgi:CCR4-NOT transcription complex subunit 4
VEELQKMKAQKRQKEQLKKQKTVDNRRHLADLRVVQKNLVFVVGIAQRIADPEMLKKPEYFGKFGKIQKVVVNPCLQGSSAGAYITYYKSDDALRAIQSVNNVPFDGRTIKASLGTTKYCSHFMRNQQCPKSECMYLHHYGDPEASFTKEDMQLGKHQEYEKKLIEDFVQQTGTVNIKKQQKQRTISGGSSSEVSSSAITPSSSFKDSNIWNNGTSGTTNSSNNNYDGGDEVLNPQDQEQDEPEPEEPILSKEENNIGIGLDDDCSNGTNNLPDDDLGFDPFHETQKAFEELIQEEVNNQRINYQSFSIHPNYSHHHHPQHHLPQQQPHPHHHRESVLAQHHSPLVHQSPQPPAQQQQQLNSGSSNIFPRTLLPPPGFNPGLIQSNSHPPPLQQQQQHNLTNHHWTNSIGPATSLNHHINHQQYKQAQVTLKEMEDWMSLDPAIIFSSNHLRQQPTMAQQAQTAPPGFPSMNGHIKTHPHY